MQKGFYQKKEGMLHKIHPFTKAAVVLWLVFTSLLVDHPVFSIALFLVFLLPLSVFSRIGGLLLKYSFAVTIPFFLLLTVLNGFLYRGDVILEVGNWVLTEEGVFVSLRIASRILIFISAFLLYLMSTSVSAQTQAILEKGFSPKIAYVLSAIILFLPLMQEKVDMILIAQRSRGAKMEGTILEKLKVLPSIFTPLLLQSLLEVGERTFALEVRGFDRAEPRTFISDLKDSAFQHLLRTFLIFLVIVEIGLWLFFRFKT